MRPCVAAARLWNQAGTNLSWKRIPIAVSAMQEMFSMYYGRCACTKPDKEISLQMNKKNLQCDIADMCAVMSISTNHEEPRGIASELKRRNISRHGVCLHVGAGPSEQGCCSKAST